MSATDRLWTIGAVLLSVGLLALGWFLGISPLLDAQAEIDTQTQSLKASNDAQRARVAVLKAQFDDLPALKEELEELQKQVPSTPSSGAFFRELDDLAAKNNITIKTYQGSPPAHYSTPAAVEGTAEVPTTSPAITPDNFRTIAVTLSVAGSLDDLTAFVGDLQFGERLFAASDITVTAEAAATDAEGNPIPGGGASGAVSATITGTIFVLLDAEAVAAEAAALATATAPSPAPTETPAP